MLVKDYLYIKYKVEDINFKRKILGERLIEIRILIRLLCFFLVFFIR